MKCIQLVQETPYASLKQAIANFGCTESGDGLSFDGHKHLYNIKYKIESILNRQLSYRAVFDYLFNALAEGLKQNFLGPNVNMEFLTLSIKVYSILLIKLVISNPSIISQKFIA